MDAIADILLVDDDPKVLEILSESLGRSGYNVKTAANARQALASVSSQPPELVLLDMMLPDMNGIELMRELRGIHVDEVPVLFLSADSDVGSRLNVLDEGAEDYLVKPVSLRELRTKIGNALRHQTRERALKRKHDSLKSKLSEGREHYDRVTRELKRQLLSMRTLFGVSQDLNRVLDSEELVNVVSLTLVGELQISSMAMFSLERENSDKFRMLGVKGFAAEKFEGVEIARQGTFVEAVEAQSASCRLARNPERSWASLLPDLRLAVFEFVTPITVRGETKGLIFTGPKISSQDYSDYDIDMMMFIANSAGIGMENARLLKQLQTTYVSTLKTMVSIIEAKDSYTKGHTERVTSYALAIAGRLGLNEKETRAITFGALLHDIGKLGVMDNIIHKSGKLSDDEWDLLKSHPVISAEIVDKMEFLTGVSEIVKHHHENWDGRGYPDGLLGDGIPLGARIVTVADAFDAMTTDRSYRRALSTEQAIERLEAGAGTQFDPRVIRVFVRYIRSKGYDLVLSEHKANE